MLYILWNSMKKEEIKEFIDIFWPAFLKDGRLEYCKDDVFCLSKGKKSLDEFLSIKNFIPSCYDDLKGRYKEGDEDVKKLFTLISYCDSTALDGKYLNGYIACNPLDIQRVVAKANVRMPNWTANFISYKNTKSIDNIAPSVRNAINYLNDPEHHLSITSDNHYKMLYEFFFDEPLKKISDNDKKKLLYEIRSYFSDRLKEIPKINQTMVITYFLYSIKKKWEKKD